MTAIGWLQILVFFAAVVAVTCGRSLSATVRPSSRALSFASPSRPPVPSRPRPAINWA